MHNIFNHKNLIQVESYYFILRLKKKNQKMVSVVMENISSRQ